MAKTFREIAEIHYGNEPIHEFDAKYRESRINALTELLTEQLNIAVVRRSCFGEVYDKWYSTTENYEFTKWINEKAITT